MYADHHITRASPEQVDYTWLHPDQPLLPFNGKPFRAVLIADEKVSEAWRERIAEWLVANRCLYFVAWGVDCALWHDSVDWAVLEAHNFGEIPDNSFVFTTWHDKQPLSEALWFAGHCASHADVALERTVLLHVALHYERARILDAFEAAQETTDI